MDSIPLPLRPLVQRLESVPGLSRSDLTSIVFIIRLGDALHRNFNATFLTLSLVHKLREKLLNLPDDLDLEIEVFATRWSYRQGTVAVTHRIAWDLDMCSVNVLSKIGLGVLDGSVTPLEGLRLMRAHEREMDGNEGIPAQSTSASASASASASTSTGTGSRPSRMPERWRLERFYRTFPGRAAVLPLMSATCAAVYFDGTTHDLGFAALTGSVAGIVAWIGSLNEQLFGVMDYLVAIAVSMISVAAITWLPESTCFGAQVLGTLYWFLYGTAFVLSLYEISNNQLMTGVTRFVQATLRSYGLAFGVAVGVWVAKYGSEERWDRIAEPCQEKTNQIPDMWFILLFPLSGVACLMQFRVGLQYFFVCLLVQCIAYGSQYLLGTVWNQPDFISNMVPAFLATIASHGCMVISHRLELTRWAMKDLYRERKKKDDDEETLPITNVSTVGSSKDGSNQPSSQLDISGVRNQDESELSAECIAFVDEGWADESGAMMMGYTRTEKIAYQRSDLFFCLLPALYLLVPGSKLILQAFSVLLITLGPDGGSLSSLDAFCMSILIVALGQVIGLRLGFATIWAGAEGWDRIKKWCRCGRAQAPEV